jgi:hypothetical protein
MCAGVAVAAALAAREAVHRRPVGAVVRIGFVVLIALLTAHALTAIAAHAHGRALVCAFLIAVYGGAVRAAVERPAVPARAVRARGPRRYH